MFGTISQKNAETSFPSVQSKDLIWTLLQLVDQEDSQQGLSPVHLQNLTVELEMKLRTHKRAKDWTVYLGQSETHTITVSRTDDSVAPISQQQNEELLKDKMTHLKNVHGAAFILKIISH